MISASLATVLLIHGGGFVSGTPATMNPWVRDFRAHRIYAVSVPYPLGDVAVATRFVGRIADRVKGPAFAYGLSAGGTIAANLAATGRVDGAVNAIGPTNLTTWRTPMGNAVLTSLGPFDQRAASPLYRLTSRATPTLTQCGLRDTWVPCEQAGVFVRAAKRYQPDSRLSVLPGAHDQSASGVRQARKWIVRRARVLRGRQ
jgi:pimeloyl-ACP methyl ester carboxylesterase